MLTVCMTYVLQEWNPAGVAHSQIRVSQRGLLAGGDARFPSSNSVPIVDQDFDNGKATASVEMTASNIVSISAFLSDNFKYFFMLSCQLTTLTASVLSFDVIQCIIDTFVGVFCVIMQRR